ncbi:MAG: hypothetical protein R3C39_07495 [Dehalococcoidia bacterium]
MTSPLLTWPEACPPETLRAETEAMAAAWVEVLRGRFGDALTAVYFKGSARKPWDSPIDYVPSLSDVDLHVRLASDADIEALDDLDAALDLAATALRAYRAHVPNPLHVPKPQLNLLNVLERDPLYAPSPPETVATLHGPSYEAHPLDEEARRSYRELDRAGLVRHVEFVQDLPMRVLDRPGALLLRIVDELNWRISPIAPRVLSMLGTPFEEAWSMNRTRLVATLEERGHADLAHAYAGYYRAGWRLFLEGFESGAAIEAVRRGVDALTQGARLAEEHA